MHDDKWSAAPTDVCYFCKLQGHWKADCPAFKASQTPENDEIGLAEQVSQRRRSSNQAFKSAGLSIKSAQAMVDDVTVVNANKAKGHWGKVKTSLVVQTVITEQLKLEHTEQVKSTFSFLVKDYQPCY